MNKKTRARFEAKISKVPTESGCLEWTSGRDSFGYGRFWVPSKFNGCHAHRVAYELHHNVKLTSDQLVTHTCDNRLCVNIQHLRLGTHQTNAQERDERGRSGLAKLTEEQVETIHLLYSSGKFTQDSLGRYFGVGNAVCSQILNGKSWKHVNIPKLTKEELDVLVAEYIDKGLKLKRIKKWKYIKLKKEGVR